jgi:PAS domain S-box-containing protein
MGSVAWPAGVDGGRLSPPSYAAAGNAGSRELLRASSVAGEDSPVPNELTLSQTVEGISALLAVMTPDGSIEVVNRQVLAYFGKTLDQLRQWATTDAVHPDDLPAVIAIWTRSLDSGEPYDIELRQRGADGVYRWFHVQGLPIRGADGRVVRWCVLQTDIEQRKHAEEALRHSERELHRLFDGVPGMIVVANSAGMTEYTNQRFLAFTGASPEQLTGLEGLRLIHPDEREVVTNAWMRCLSLREPLELDHRLRRFDGIYRWVHVRVAPRLDDQGRIVRWYGLLTDIDDERKAQEARRSSEHHLRLLVEKIPALITRNAADGVMDYVNPRVVEYSGQGLGQLGMDLVHPDDRYIVLRNWKHALTTGEAFEDTYRIRRADGEYRWFNHKTEPLHDRDGRVVCWYTVSLDIDARTATEEILRTTRRKLTAAMHTATVAELSASIAHEINQPLASVVTNAEACQTWLSHDPPNLVRARSALGHIIRDGHSAAEVVRRIRALFKEVAPVKAPLDMAQIVAGVLRLLSDELRENGIRVETDMEADLPTLQADAVQIQQTLINLIHNAIEAMEGVTSRAKLLVLSSRRQGAELLVEVRDNGVGIKDSTNLFAPFFTTKRSGMGMGLSITRSIVEAHGGRIWAAANEDAGTTFSLALPALDGST